VKFFKKKQKQGKIRYN